jgi:preprotein translocase subunit SecE
MALEQAPRTQTRRRSSSSPADTGDAGDIGVVRFLRETWDELRKVVWSSPTELYRYTVVVLVTVAVIVVFIGSVDYGLQEVAKRYIYGALTSGSGALPSPGP